MVLQNQIYFIIRQSNGQTVYIFVKMTFFIAKLLYHHPLCLSVSFSCKHFKLVSLCSLIFLADHISKLFKFKNIFPIITKNPLKCILLMYMQSCLFPSREVSKVWYVSLEKYKLIINITYFFAKLLYNSY